MALKFDLMVVVVTIGLLAALAVLHGLKDDMPGGTIVQVPTGGTLEGPVPSGTLSIRYSFGVGEKNVLDTSRNLYIKDMVCDPPRDYEMVLDDDDTDEIQEALLRNDFFDIPEDLTENCDSSGRCMDVSPLFSATLTATMNGEKRTVKWAANYYNPKGPDVVKFREIKAVIEEIISEKEEELDIPEPRCAYL